MILVAVKERLQNGKENRADNPKGCRRARVFVLITFDLIFGFLEFLIGDEKLVLKKVLGKLRATFVLFSSSKARWRSSLETRSSY